MNMLMLFCGLDFLVALSISGFSKIVGLEIRLCSAKKKKCKLKKWNQIWGLFSILSLPFEILQIHYVHHQGYHLSPKSHTSFVFSVLYSPKPKNWSSFYTALCSCLLTSSQLKKYFNFLNTSELQNVFSISTKRYSSFLKWDLGSLSPKVTLVSYKSPPTLVIPTYPSVSDPLTPFPVHWSYTLTHTQWHTMYIYCSIPRMFQVFSHLCA